MAEDNGKSIYKGELSTSCPAIQAIYNSNPYCLLGISATSTKKDALDTAEKLKKYSKLGILDTYISDYDLKYFSHPDRSEGRIQTAMNSLDSLESKWLWFSDGFMSDIWYVNSAFSNSKDELTYNSFLARIYQCMILDSGYQDWKRWQDLLNTTDYVVTLDDNALNEFISCQLSDEDKQKYQIKLIIESFRDVIVGLFVSNIKNQDAPSNNRLLIILERVKVSFKNYLKKVIADWAVSWVTVETSKIDAIVEQSNNDDFCIGDLLEVIKNFEHIKSCGKEENGFNVLNNIVAYLNGYEVYSSLLQEKLKNTIWVATDVLTKNHKRYEAAVYDSYIYNYCSPEEKDSIKNIDSLEVLNLPESELTDEECYNEAIFWKEEEKLTLFIKWLKIAVSKGNPSAMNELGVAYCEGNGVLKDENIGISWYNKAAEKGDACALHNLAVRIYNGDLNGGEEKAKMYWLRSYLTNPDTGSDEELDDKFPGWKFEEVPDSLIAIMGKDPDKLESIAENGISHAQFILGKYLIEGTGSYEVDYEEGIRWMFKAKESKFEPAIKYLEKNVVNLYYKNNKLYSPGSWYREDVEHDGLEIYFKSNPNSKIREALNNSGWVEFNNCWCGYDNRENLDLAKKITGNNLRE